MQLTISSQRQKGRCLCDNRLGSHIPCPPHEPTAGPEGRKSIHQFKVVPSVRALKSWAIRKGGDRATGTVNGTLLFTGTRLENAYLAFVPFLKNPGHEMLGKKHDGGERNMESTVHYW